MPIPARGLVPEQILMPLLVRDPPLRRAQAQKQAQVHHLAAKQALMLILAQTRVQPKVHGPTQIREQAQVHNLTPTRAPLLAPTHLQALGPTRARIQLPAQQQDQALGLGLVQARTREQGLTHGPAMVPVPVPALAKDLVRDSDTTTFLGL